jgi:signal transduction histidine kinase
MIALAKSKGAGWVEYKWAHPITNENVLKNSYIEKLVARGCTVQCYYSRAKEHGRDEG